MNTETTNNDNLVNEYINVLVKKLNDVSLEVVTLQTRLNVLSREKEQLLAGHAERDQEIDDLKQKLIAEKNNVKEVEVIKEVIKEVEVPNEVVLDDSVKKENTLLRREIQQADEKIRKLKSQLQEK